MDAAPTFVFLICSERSGSNLVTRMFDAHPGFCGPAPVHLVRLLCDHALRYGPLEEDRWWDLLIGDVVALLETQVGTWRTAPTAEALREAVAPRDAGALLRHVWLAEAHAHGKTRLFLKENHTPRHLPFVLAAFPDARFLLQVRDPRDMALSWKERRELRGDVVRAATTWTEDQAEAARALGQLRLAGRVAWTRYEDLISRPEEELARVCGALGTGFHASMLAFHEDPHTREVAGATEAWGNLARPLISGNHGRWRAGLDEAEARYVEWRCAEGMRLFGYTPELPPLGDDEGAALEAELRARERHEKPGYAEIPGRERLLRARRAELLRGIAARPLRA